MGFQQNRNIKGELAQASLFLLLKGTTAPTGFLGWRDEIEAECEEEEEGVCGAFSLNSFYSHSFLYHTWSPAAFISLRPAVEKKRWLG